MREIVWFLRGYLVLEIKGASPGWALNRLTAARIPFWRVVWRDSFTLEVCVLLRDRERAEQAVAGAMCDCRLVEKIGLRWSVGGLLRRPVLLVMLALSFLAVSVIPNFVLFYSVSGNETVPEEAILRELQTLGVGFGTFGPSIKPQWIKDRMLNILPLLQWITVTQNGCRAEVIVRERPAPAETEERRDFANVIATQSGVIVKQSVLAGQAMYQVGDVVEKGDLLVSGIVDLERTYAVEHAKAEIYARTWRTKDILIPNEYGEKVYTGAHWTCVWLTIGEKRIKIFGNSGISATACDKMIEMKRLSLPGGLEFPVSLTVETFLPYEMETGTLAEPAAQLLLTDYAERAARQDMVAGEILKSQFVLMERDGCYRLSSTLECQEMIAKTVKADWLGPPNGTRP